MFIGESRPVPPASRRIRPVFTLLTLLSAWIFATLILLTTQGVLYPGFLLLTMLPAAFAFVLYRESNRVLMGKPVGRVTTTHLSSVASGH